MEYRTLALVAGAVIAAAPLAAAPVAPTTPRIEIVLRGVAASPAGAPVIVAQTPPPVETAPLPPSEAKKAPDASAEAQPPAKPPAKPVAVEAGQKAPLPPSRPVVVRWWPDGRVVAAEVVLDDFHAIDDRRIEAARRTLDDSARFPHAPRR